MSKQWKCMTCESITRFKGLCRDCTEYDDAGAVVTPVARVRIDEFGKEYVIKRPERQKVSHEMLCYNVSHNAELPSVNEPLMQERLKAEAEAMKVVAETEVSDDGLMEFGESVESEEE